MLKSHEYAKVFYASWAIDWIHNLDAIRLFFVGEEWLSISKVNAKLDERNPKNANRFLNKLDHLKYIDCLRFNT